VVWTELEKEDRIGRLPPRFTANWSLWNESNSIDQEALCALQNSQTQGQTVCDLQ
jgi:hypothetical protein